MNDGKTVSVYQPKNKNTQQVKRNISERTRALASFYSEYSEYSEEEVVDEFLLLNLVKDDDFIEWAKSRRNNKRILKTIGIEE